MQIDPSAVKTLVLEVTDRLHIEDRADLVPLFTTAVQSAVRAYATYSGFHVGAAIKMASGEIVRGCNVENVSYPIGVCAERNALGAAVVGRSDHSDLPAELALFAFDASGAQASCTPCGACRQAIHELNPDCDVHFFIGTPLALTTRPVGTLLPLAFQL